MGRVVFGKVATGPSRNRLHIYSGSIFSTGLITCALPLLVKLDFGGFVAFVVIFGLFAGSFIALMPVVTADLVGLPNLPPTLGLEFTSQGFTALCGPVVAVVIADITGSYAYSFLVAGLALMYGAIPLLLVTKLVGSAASPIKSGQEAR